jgi:hypothetical protein
MLELRHAKSDTSKPIVVLVTQSMDEKWANNEIVQACSTADKKYVDISQICELKDDDGNPLKDKDGNLWDWGNPNEEMVKKLSNGLKPLFKILKQLKVPQSMNPDGLLRRLKSSSSSLSDSDSSFVAGGMRIKASVVGGTVHGVGHSISPSVASSLTDMSMKSRDTSDGNMR